ncbi:DinB family protein [Brevibacillus massiliensis]|jgi:hypothetical protein|uniref:DinB family protein n=1 Tax=Brevibacillus massiliensis TaxID=1118054 RepID=UPI000312243B|nr:DinB family protein [Brevibacillus massiliensis]
MKTKEMLQQFESLAHYYLEEMDHYTLEEFTRKPAADEWSLGQMYNHLHDAALHMQLAAVRKCAEGSAATGEKTDIGKQIFAAGQFPPVRIKVPASPDYTPANPTDLESVREQFRLLIETMREVELTLSRISDDAKVEHPRFGFLNATEWFQVVCMHFQHHLRQKERLDQMIRSGK